MKLSTKTRYGMRAMCRLAADYGGRTVPLNELARKEEISFKYLEQIMSVLKAKGLIIAIRGSGGGYRLSKSPAEVSLLDIVECFEGSLAPVECVDYPDFCSRSPDCPTRGVWIKIKEQIRELLSGLTLLDMVEGLPGGDEKENEK